MYAVDARERVVDLTDSSRNVLFNLTLEEARQRVASGDPQAVAGIDGQFALVATSGILVRMARSISRPLRFFIAKKSEGPYLLVADRIDAIHAWLEREGLADQFHPSYTRMIPAHHLTEVALVGCPDPSPRHARFFDPPRGDRPADVPALGRAYITALADELRKWFTTRARTGPIGVEFSGGIDSGSVFLVALHVLRELGESPSRLKAFTLAVDGAGSDVAQARQFLDTLGLGYFLEPIEVAASAIDWRRAVRVVEDYKPLDIQAAAVGVALGEAIRQRYPEWKYLLDGDGGDENLKDYPIEENPELTIRSVLHNSMLYQEGWGVGAIKHSQTYSGGLSRGYVRTYAPASQAGFEVFSPYTQPSLITIAEGIPFIELTQYDHERLYRLKGELVASGVEAVTGYRMPIFEKCRFQRGALEEGQFSRLFPARETDYRRAFHGLYE
ncbi:MAG: asparagine synthase-related protein [Gemmataceae bacterium]